jgi:hypothetical protein
MIRESRRRAERGETLVELLMTITILAIAVVAIAGGLGDAIFSSTLHRGHTTADGLVRTAAECIKDRSVTYQANGSYGSCTPLGVSITTKWWNGDAPPTFSATQNGNGLESITISGTSGRGAQSVVIYKRVT